MKPIYIVTFEIHKDCQIKNYVYYCHAQNAKEAVAKAKDGWRSHIGHQFNLHAVKSRVQDTKAISVRSVMNTLYEGESVIGKFILTDLHTWRINGRNLYA